MGVEPILSVLQTEFLNRKNVSSTLDRTCTYITGIRSLGLYLIELQGHTIARVKNYDILTLRWKLSTFPLRHTRMVKPIFTFGARHPHTYKEEVGFGPTDVISTPLVFKTNAISQTLPLFQKLCFLTKVNDEPSSNVDPRFQT